MNLRKNKLVIITNGIHCKDSKENFYIRSGFETQINDFAKRFKEVELYSPKTELKIKGTKLIKGIRVYPLSKDIHNNHLELILKFPEYVFSLIKIISKQEINTIFLIYIPASYIGLIALFLTKVFRSKVICRVTNDLVLEHNIRRNYYGKKIINMVLNFFYNPLLNFLLKNYPSFFSGNIFLKEKSNFYQITSLSFTKSQIPTNIRPRKNIKNIYFVGRFDENKGVMNIFKIIDSLPYNINLNIIGWGEQECLIKKKYFSLNKNDRRRVNLIGFVPFGKELFEHYKLADILLFPSKAEYQGKSYLEAMFFGCPVIASDLPAIRQFIKHGENGYLFDPNNINEIVKYINLLNKEPDILNSISSNAYQSVKNFSVESINDFVYSKSCVYYQSKG